MITILIPVLGRSSLIRPLVRNIKAVTEEKHRIVFICSPDDETTDVCKKVRSTTTIVANWKPDVGDFAKKINFAYRKIESEWYFQAATDLVFHPRWATYALAAGRNQRVGVVGTNDLYNPLVTRGSHSTHTLFSREYIEVYGGTYDGSGEVFSEAYDHQFVDTEFVQTAVLRRQFTPCLRAVVEHMHPHWNKAEDDDTYKKAMRAVPSDTDLYTKRMRAVRFKAQQERAVARRRR